MGSLLSERVQKVIALEEVLELESFIPGKRKQVKKGRRRIELLALVWESREKEE